MPEVDRVLGNAEKLDAATWAATSIAGAARVVVNDIMSVRETAPHLVDGFEGRTRAIVQVQNGCDHRCTFCIIPYGRGNSRSVPMGEVVNAGPRPRRARLPRGRAHRRRPDELRRSICPARRGSARWSKQILKHVPDLPRLRLSSIDSVEADRDLIDAFAERRHG